eukprot:c12259_g1_i1 orf=17-178(+)
MIQIRLFHVHASGYCTSPSRSGYEIKPNSKLQIFLAKLQESPMKMPLPSHGFQ